MKKFFVLIAALALISCARVMVPTQSDADRAAQKWPGTTLSDLDKGKAIYQANCNKCHPYKSPTSRNEEAWNKIIPQMAKKAKLSSEDESLVLKYVVTMSGRKKS